MKKELSLTTKLGVSFLLIILLGIVAATTAGIIMLFHKSTAGNVAVISLEGVIAAGNNGLPQRGVVTSDLIINDLKDAAKRDDIKAIILLINSPGGSAVASDEVAQKVKTIKKPVIAVIREVGASGAYWIASSTDKIFANRMSITGSIGVIGSYLSFGRFLEHWNVTYNRLVAGELKDLGTPFRELTPRERAFLQEKLEKIHQEFIRTVAENRNLSVENVTAIADGRFLLGSEALDDGLIDRLGTLDDALEWINATLQIEPEPVFYTQKPSLVDVLSNLKTHPLTTADARLSIPMAK